MDNRGGATDGEGLWRQITRGTTLPPAPWKDE